VIMNGGLGDVVVNIITLDLLGLFSDLQNTGSIDTI